MKQGSWQFENIARASLTKVRGGAACVEHIVTFLKLEQILPKLEEI